MITNIRKEATFVATCFPDASPDEARLIAHARFAISKVDNRGPRGVEKVTNDEIIALIVLAVILGGELFASAANHKPEGE